MTDLPYLSASVRRSLQTLTVLLPDETEVWRIHPAKAAVVSCQAAAAVPWAG